MGSAVVGRKTGLRACANPLHARAGGIVEDETQNMLLIRSEDGKARRVPKSASSFIMEGGARVDGAKIRGKMQDRMKKA